MAGWRKLASGDVRADAGFSAPNEPVRWHIYEDGECWIGVVNEQGSFALEARMDPDGALRVMRREEYDTRAALVFCTLVSAISSWTQEGADIVLLGASNAGSYTTRLRALSGAEAHGLRALDKRLLTLDARDAHTETWELLAEELGVEGWAEHGRDPNYPGARGAVRRMTSPRRGAGRMPFGCPWYGFWHD